MALNNYEDTLTSYIQDNDKLVYKVTYKWFSKKFEIHANVAKNILKQYWEKYKNNKIVATFLLAGQLNDKSICIEVVRESNLKAAKDKFININCKHLYSLQNSLKDLEFLAFADEGDFHYSAIKFNAINKSNENMHSLQYITNVKKEENKLIRSNKLDDRFLEKQISNETHCFSNTTIKNLMKENNIKDRKKSKNKKNLEFQLEKKTVVSEKVICGTKLNNNLQLLKINSKVKGTSIKPKKLRVNDIFTKSSNKLQISEKMKGFNSDKHKSLLDFNELEIQVHKESTTKLLTGKEEHEISNICKKKDKKNLQSEIKIKNRDVQNKKRSHSQENMTLNHKRIIIMDSSEDEYSNIDDKKKQIKIERNVSNVFKKSSESTAKEENIKYMIKKTIDKTFKDEDGYLVTKKVHVYEVANKNDEFIEIKTKEFSKPVKIKAKKQTTLTNFFKK